MNKLLLTTSCLLLSATATFGQVRVVNKYGQEMDAPAFDSPAASMIGHGRCAFASQTDLARKAIGTYTPNYLAREGSPRILTVLVNYQDDQFSVNSPHAAFDEFFNSKTALTDFGNANNFNFGSVSQYFSDMSQSTFQPIFDVYGPVTLPNNKAYYGGTDNAGSDEKPREMVTNALNLVSDSIHDVSVYDGDGDGYIDCVYIIYAGLGQNNGGKAETVWAKTGLILGETFKGKSLGWYSMASELSPYKVSDENPSMMISGVGVPCHELSHAMGLPDIYPTSAAAQQVRNQEMEYWDLMDGGEYTYNGYRPTAYTAWEKSQMGWPVDIRQLEGSQSVTMETTTEAGGTAYKIVNAEQPTEFFLLENIQRKSWNRYVPGHGLLVYHVDETGNEAIHINTRLNNTPGKPGMAVVPADGTCLSSYIDAGSADYMASFRGDPFPGSQDVTALDDDLGLPNFYWYHGTNPAAKANAAFHKVYAELSGIQESDGVLTFNFIHNDPTGIQLLGGNTTGAAGATAFYTLSGVYAGSQIQQLPKGVYICGGRKIVVH